MILIKNAKLLSMAEINGDIVDILTEGTKIKAIGKIDEKDYPQAKVIDAKCLTVTPGLVDAHCHIGLFEEIYRHAGADGNEVTDPILPQLRGIDAVKPHDVAFEGALKAGVTTVVTGPGSANVIGGTFCALKTKGKTIYDMCMVEEVAMKMALGENPKNCYGSMKKLPSTRMGSAAVLREALEKAKRYRDELVKAKEDKEAKKPTYDAKCEALAKVFDGMPVKIHAHQADDIVTAIRIMEEYGLKGTIDHCTEGYLIPEVLKEHNMTVIIGPTLGNKSKVELKNKSFESGKVLLDHGVEFALMTDHPVIHLENTLTQAAIFVRNGLTPEQMLRAITIIPAKINGLDDRVGSIEVGKDADILIWDMDDIYHYMAKPTVIINGEIVE